MWWATTSCNSRAIVVRSSSSVRLSRSTAVTSCCALTSAFACRRIWILLAITRAKAEVSAISGMFDPQRPLNRTEIAVPSTRVSVHIQAATRGPVRRVTRNMTTM